MHDLGNIIAELVEGILNSVFGFLTELFYMLGELFEELLRFGVE